MTDADLRDFLDGAVPAPPHGLDGQSIVRRARARRTRLRRAGALAVVLAVLGGVGAGVVLTGTEDEPTSLAEDPPGIGLLLLTSDGLRDESDVVTPLEAPTGRGVMSLDGDQLVYVSAAGGIPSIRVLDRRTKQDRLLARDAESVAWQGAGKLAYVQHQDVPEDATPYPGAVVVRSGLDGTPIPWTKGYDDDTVLAWAGDSLLVSRRQPTGDRKLLALTGPGPDLTLPGELVAVSPDGRQVLTTPVAGPPVLQVVDVATGQVVQSLPMTQDGSLGRVHTLGAWTEQDAVVQAGSSLVVLSKGTGGLEVTQRIPFADADAVAIDLVADRVHVLSDGPSTTADPLPNVRSCDLMTGACAKPLAVEGLVGWVVNPSSDFVAPPPPASTPTVAPARSAPCEGSALSAALGQPESMGTGLSGYYLVVTNRGTAPCRVDGDWAYEVRDARGRVMPIGQPTPRTPRPAVDLPPGEAVTVIVNEFRCDLMGGEQAAELRVSVVAGDAFVRVAGRADRFHTCTPEDGVRGLQVFRVD